MHSSRESKTIKNKNKCHLDVAILPLLRLTQLAYWKIELRLLLVWYSLLEWSLAIDYDQMAFYHTDTDRRSRPHSTRPLWTRFSVDFCRQRNIPVVGTCMVCMWTTEKKKTIKIRSFRANSVQIEIG